MKTIITSLLSTAIITTTCGLDDQTYSVYTPNSNTFENPVSGKYGSWHLDEFAVTEKPEV